MRMTINISVSKEMYSVIQKNAEAGCYGSVSEYIRSLVRRDARDTSMQVKWPPVRTANQCLESAARSLDEE